MLTRRSAWRWLSPQSLAVEAHEFLYGVFSRD
jgi:hypothetical protein